jgi:transcription initiation factor IIE alpha subunit
MIKVVENIHFTRLVDHDADADDRHTRFVCLECKAAKLNQQKNHNMSIQIHISLKPHILSSSPPPHQWRKDECTIAKDILEKNSNNAFFICNNQRCVFSY